MEQQIPEQELFQNVDEEMDDLWLSVYVRRHFDLEAEEMHAQLTDETPDPAELARLEGWLDSLQRRQSLKGIWKKLYQGMQKAAVFLVVLAAGFVMVFLDVKAVQDVVLENLQSVNPYYISIHIKPTSPSDETADYDKLKFNWLPEHCRAEIGKQDEAIYIRSNSRIVGVVLYAENGITFLERSASSTNITISGYTNVALSEERDWCDVVAVLPDGGYIGIESIDKGTFGLTTTEMIRILQTLNVEESVDAEQ